jgi:hypothetical protein
MPFGEKVEAGGAMIDFDEVYEYLIKPAAEALGLTCVRSDDLAKPGWVHADMLGRILKDDVAIVDITTLNPNVFYELGIRHVLRPFVTVLMRKEGTEIPFNIKGFRVLEYGLGLKAAHTAKSKLIDYIKTGLAAKTNDSLVYAVFPNLKVSME